MGFNFETIFIVVVVFSIGSFLISFLKNKTIKGAIFGGKINRTLGEIALDKKGLMKSKLKIHSIKKDGQTNIGLEFEFKGFLSYQMIPVTLTREEARRLIDLIQMGMSET